MIPAITVVVQAFNAERFLAETVDSVRAQSRGDWEIVIVDGGSTDGTLAIAAAAARRDARVRTVRQGNAGNSAARNQGLAESDARTRFVLFLGQEDVLAVDALERLAAAADADRASVGAHGRIAVIDGDSGRPEGADALERLSRERPIPCPDGGIGVLPAVAPTTLDSVAVFNPLHSPGVALLKRDTLERAGGFDPAAEPVEDWDLWLRLTRRGPLAFVDAVTLRCRLNPEGVAPRGAERVRSAERAVRRKALADPAYSDAQKAVLLRGHQSLHRVRAGGYWDGPYERRERKNRSGASQRERVGVCGVGNAPS